MSILLRFIQRSPRMWNAHNAQNNRLYTIEKQNNGERFILTVDHEDSEQIGEVVHNLVSFANAKNKANSIERSFLIMKPKKPSLKKQSKKGADYDRYFARMKAFYDHQGVLSGDFKDHFEDGDLEPVTILESIQWIDQYLKRRSEGDRAPDETELFTQHESYLKMVKDTWYSNEEEDEEGELTVLEDWEADIGSLVNSTLTRIAVAEAEEKQIKLQYVLVCIKHNPKTPKKPDMKVLCLDVEAQENGRSDNDADYWKWDSLTNANWVKFNSFQQATHGMTQLHLNADKLKGHWPPMIARLDNGAINLDYEIEQDD